MPDVRNMVAQIRSPTFPGTLTMNGLGRKSRDDHKKIKYNPLNVTQTHSGLGDPLGILPWHEYIWLELS